MYLTATPEIESAHKASPVRGSECYQSGGGRLHPELLGLLTGLCSGLAGQAVGSRGEVGRLLPSQQDLGMG